MPAWRVVYPGSLYRGRWLYVRRGGSGCSVPAAAVGMNPYKSPLELWLEKTGRATGNEAGIDTDSPMYWGTLLEG
jgi:predicted phage-related endonuclease